MQIIQLAREKWGGRGGKTPWHCKRLMSTFLVAVMMHHRQLLIFKRYFYEEIEI